MMGVRMDFIKGEGEEGSLGTGTRGGNWVSGGRGLNLHHHLVLNSAWCFLKSRDLGNCSHLRFLQHRRLMAAFL